jgi:hypothetical protein
MADPCACFSKYFAGGAHPLDDRLVYFMVGFLLGGVAAAGLS